MTSIRAKIRYLLGDTSQSISDIFQYSTSSIFTLSESNPISITDVLRNDVSSGVTYTYNSTTKKVTVTSSLTAGDNVEIQYTYYPNYSDTELTNYVQAALVDISNNHYYEFQYDTTDDAIYPEPTDREENLIATVAAMRIEPDNKTYRLPDLTINAPSDLPREDKIAKFVSKFKHNSHGILDII